MAVNVGYEKRLGHKREHDCRNQEWPRESLVWRTPVSRAGVWLRLVARSPSRKRRKTPQWSCLCSLHLHLQRLGWQLMSKLRRSWDLCKHDSGGFCSRPGGREGPASHPLHLQEWGFTPPLPKCYLFMARARGVRDRAKLPTLRCACLFSIMLFRFMCFKM